MKKAILLISFLFLLPVGSWAACTGSSPNWMTTPDYTSVASCVSQASSGDTVTISAGSATWSSRLTITQGITLKGNGSTGANKTAITNNYGNGLIYINPSPGWYSSQVLIRVTALYINGSTSGNPSRANIYINAKVDGTIAANKIRIDNNYFELGGRCITPTGWITGVIDHNTFLNCNIAIAGYGDGDYAWARMSNLAAYGPGTSDFLFIENNTFRLTSDMNQQIYGNSHGNKFVVRYNIFDGTSMTENYLAWESHGNWGSIVGGRPSFRGSPVWEIYENTINMYKSYTSGDWRGGSLLFYNNIYTVTTGSPSSMALKEEEAWGAGNCPALTLFPPPGDTVWPVWDQVTNSFFWGNTWNGASLNPINYCTGQATVIRQNYEYFLHVPEVAGGKSTYSIDTCSGYTYIHGNPDCMTFSAVGANAYYPYTAYQYPHELVSEDTTPPVITNTTLASYECSTDPRNVILQVNTNEASTCKYNTTDVAYDSMSSTFGTTGGTTHSQVVSLACDASYTRYVRCMDASPAHNKNSSSTTVSFSIAAAVGDTAAPVLANALPVTGSYLFCSTNPLGVTLGVTALDETTPIMVKYHTSDVAYDSMAGTMNDGDYYETVNLACGAVYTYCYRAADSVGTPNKSSSSLCTTFTVLSQATPGYIQGESGTNAGDMADVVDLQADGGQYIYSTVSFTGTATFTVTVATTDTYRVVARVYALDTGADSMYLQIDALPEIWSGFNIGSGSEGYNIWKSIIWCAASGASCPDYQVDLDAGEHTFVFRGREALSRLDYFYLESIGIPTQPPLPVSHFGIGTFGSGVGQTINIGAGVGTVRID